MPHTQVPTSGLSDADFDKIDKETIDQKNILVKNRFFDLNVTSNDFHQVLYKYQNAKFAFFLDLIENSMLDMIVVSNFPTGIGRAPDGTPLPELSAVYNNLMSDSFFVKSRMLTDEKISSPVRSASFRAVLTDLNDQKFVVQASDNGQTTFGALNPPNTMIGVGRSNNFVEMFTVSAFEKGKRQQRDWSPIIPESVLYVYSDMKDDPSDWQLSLLVNPTSKINMILVVDAMLLLIIGLIIIVLYFKEKSEDEKEQVDAFNYF